MKYESASLELLNYRMRPAPSLVCSCCFFSLSSSFSLLIDSKIANNKRALDLLSSFHPHCGIDLPRVALSLMNQHLTIEYEITPYRIASNQPTSHSIVAFKPFDYQRFCVKEQLGIFINTGTPAFAVQPSFRFFLHTPHPTNQPSNPIQHIR